MSQPTTVSADRVAIIKDSRLFDANYYSKKYNVPVEECACHFLQRENFDNDASSAFSSSQYYADNPDVAKNGHPNALLHYELYGRKENRLYRNNNELTAGDIRLLHNIFDPDFYIKRNMDRAALATIDPISHALGRANLGSIKLGAYEDTNLINIIESSYLFDKEYYNLKYHIHPALASRHYLVRQNWLNNPSKAFSSKKYFKHYGDVENAQVNPLIHYHHLGIGEGRIYRPVLDSELSDYFLLSALFDQAWYANTYMDKASLKDINPIDHYAEIGWKKGYLPRPDFDLDAFNRKSPDANECPVLYCLKNRLSESFIKPAETPVNYGFHTGAFLNYMHINRQVEYAQELLGHKKAKKLILFLLTDIDCISGGLMSISGMYDALKRMRNIHGAEVVASTLPGGTYLSKFSFFENDMPILHYNQLGRIFKNVEHLLIMLPELYLRQVYQYLLSHEDSFIIRPSFTHLNLLNQNVELMPFDFEVDRMRSFFDKITQTTAHKKYTSKKMRDLYGVPVHQIIPPIRRNIIRTSFSAKKDIVIYSPDEHPLKDAILQNLERKFPQFEFIEIRDMKFSEYLDLISKARFSISFGEGLDGYFTEAYQAGGVGFTFWNDDFFHDDYAGVKSILPNFEAGLTELPALMRELCEPNAYNALSDQVYDIWFREYGDPVKIENSIRQFLLGNYDHP